jgi:GntR family L-lactate dehydrogenase operon transcriptional regulator
VALRRRGATAAQLSEARITLEGQAAYFAAQRATPEDIERLEDALELLEESIGVEHVRFDLAFHMAIAAAAHNPVIEMMLEAIAPLTVALMARSVGDPKVMDRSQPYHRIALQAIRAGDSGAARHAMEAHLGVAQELYGEDFERSVYSLAERSVQSSGLASLDSVVGDVIGREREGSSRHRLPPKDRPGS